MKEETWNKEIEEARERYGWSDIETADVYKIATGIMRYIKEKSIEAIKQV